MKTLKIPEYLGEGKTKAACSWCLSGGVAISSKGVVLHSDMYNSYSSLTCLAVMSGVCQGVYNCGVSGVLGCVQLWCQGCVRVCITVV